MVNIFTEMDRCVGVLFVTVVFISIVQTLHAITEDEYKQRTEAIKSKSEVQEFLKDNEFIISQYGLFFEKLAQMFTHIIRTTHGSHTLKHVWDETVSILNEEKTFDFIREVLIAAKDVLTTATGARNVLAMAKFVRSDLRVANMFKMCTPMMEMFLNLLLSDEGIDSLTLINESNQKCENSKELSKLMKIFDKELPILSLPAGSTDGRKKHSQMKLLLGKMNSLRTSVKA